MMPSFHTEREYKQTDDSTSNFRINREMEVRKLPPAVVFHLVEMLECDGAWKKVMALVRQDPTPTHPCPIKYTAQHIRMVENASTTQRRCTEIFLEEWGSSGRKRPTLSNLLDLLVQAQLYRAVEYVSTKLLNEPPPPRPTAGPAAVIDTEKELRAFSPSVEASALPRSGSSVSSRVNPTAPPENISQNGLPGEQVSCSDNSLVSSTIYIEGSADEDRAGNQSSGQIQESRRLGQLLETTPLEQVNGFTISVKAFNFKELESATNNFDDRLVGNSDGRLLGTGAIGAVYLAVLNDTQKVAVKRLHKDAVHVDLQFRNEVEALSRLQHPNLLPLIGYSCDGPAKCLVYQFMNQGNLQERLACQGAWKEALPWQVRVKVGLGTARGLLHLHTAGSRPLVHRDVKSANILLDTDLTPKLGDFGLVRLGASGQETQSVAVTTTVFGTSAYMAPEAFRGDVSVKMDTFSFGVVLLELLTALPPFDESRDGCDLVTHIGETCADSITPLLDLKAGNWTTETGTDLSTKLFNLSQECLEEKRKRPNMLRVVKCLEDISI